MLEWLLLYDAYEFRKGDTFPPYRHSRAQVFCDCQNLAVVTSYQVAELMVLLFRS